MKRWNNLRKLWAPFSESRASVYAASACYYILLSILPSALLFMSLLPNLPISFRTWEIWFSQLLPEPFQPVAAYVLEQIERSEAFPYLSLSALTVLWSASKGIIAITDGLNAVLCHEEPVDFFRKRVLGMRSFLFFMLLLILLLIGQTILSGYFAFALLILLFAMLYRFLPGRKLPFRCSILGGAFTATGWITVSWLFSVYVDHFDRYHRLYGTIGLLILACIWLQICILMILYGAILAELAHSKSYHPIQIIKDTFS